MNSPKIFWSNEDNGYVAQYENFTVVEDTKEKAWEELCKVLSCVIEIYEEDLLIRTKE